MFSVCALLAPLAPDLFGCVARNRKKKRNMCLLFIKVACQIKCQGVCVEQLKSQQFAKVTVKLNCELNAGLQTQACSLVMGLKHLLSHVTAYWTISKPTDSHTAMIFLCQKISLTTYFCA